MPDWPRAAVVVLNWNGRHLLPACLDALIAQDYPNFTLAVVDNASSDDSQAILASEFPQVTLVQNETNLGYAGGNNVVLRQLESEFAVLVNPDIVVDPGWLRALLAPMLADETIGIAGCKLRFPDGMLNHAGGQITLPQAFPRHAGGHEVDTGQHETLRDVDYVIGAAVALRRAMLNEIGLLDEGYFLYFEDADLCARARRARWRVVYVPQATAVHDESALAVKGSSAYLERFHRGRWRYLLKHVAPEVILDETLPAEQAWLTTCDAAERAAADVAYRATLAQLPDIWVDRLQDGAPLAGSAQAEQIGAGLRQLRQQAVFGADAAAEGLAELARRAHIEERPFTSTTPLIGPLLARLRAAWASVAARWYVRQLTHQQNQFNQALLQRLREDVETLREVTAVYTTQDNELTGLSRQQVELQIQLARAAELIDDLEERLQRLEQGARR